MTREPGGTVRFDVDAPTAFDYLVDPQHRPEWQSSLRRVVAVDGRPRVGQTWTDVTKPGLHAAMETTVLERPRLWAESGTWRFVRADLTLRFTPVGDAACDVHFRFRIHALGPLGLGASVLSVPAVRGDLRRAARLLAGR
ncbi:SRPBCC family protein [Nocardioides sp.]|uniref:SRPBCC family protein n=1 Tax=Nocardioides sp. TaxID=35761 RepID=UPI001A2AA103|nr:SRPBCC family protein [Nocardioides sp.]MBJ7358980.1 SRPBCC family protein [Nocardioides sp.]